MSVLIALDPIRCVPYIDSNIPASSTFFGTCNGRSSVVGSRMFLRVVLATSELAGKNWTET